MKGMGNVCSSGAHGGVYQRSAGLVFGSLVIDAKGRRVVDRFRMERRTNSSCDEAAERNREKAVEPVMRVFRGS